MAVGRPFWKGFLKLSLVSCPIALYTAASSAERIAFRQINKATGNRLRQQLIDEVTQKPVDSADKGRGYEYAKGAYLQIEDDDIEAVTIESTHTIDIDSFVPRAQIDERYFDSPYYIVPEGKIGEDAFAVIREAMKVKGMAALGRVVLSKRERVIMLQPWEKGILGETLRYAYEVRDASDYFEDISDIKIQKEMLELAQHIVASKTDEFDPSQCKDRYEDALVKMLKAKSDGLPAPKNKPSAAPSNVVDLMAALRKSVTASASNDDQRGGVKKAKPRSAAGQRELLMPIPGGGKKAVAKQSPTAPARKKAG